MSALSSEVCLCKKCTDYSKISQIILSTILLKAQAVKGSMFFFKFHTVLILAPVLCKECSDKYTQQSAASTTGRIGFSIVSDTCSSLNNKGKLFKAITEYLCYGLAELVLLSTVGPQSQTE